jgi:DNA-directed RNA polymerase specialized sigma24 family protein
VPAGAALEFVTRERRLIRSMIREFLGDRGNDFHDVEDLIQDLWIHLRVRLERGMPCGRRRRTVMITITRNFLRNRRRAERAGRRKPYLLLSLSRSLPDTDGETAVLQDLVSQRHLDTRRGGHPSPEDAAEWRLDVSGEGAKLPQDKRSFLERLPTMSVSEAAQDLGIARSTGYRWRRFIRERFGNLVGPEV